MAAAEEGAKWSAASALLALGAVGAGGSYLLPALAALSPALRRRYGVRDRIERTDAFALTFDDGPHPQGTPAVLEILDRAQVRATFFLVGEQVRRNRTLTAEISAAGHAIGIHCDRHRNLLRLPPRALRADLQRAAATIEEVTGAPLRLYRPPYGILNGAAVAFASARGWQTYLWSTWGKDWELRASAHSIAELLLAGASGGGVGLLHDADHYSASGSHVRTAAALPAIIEGLAMRGLQPVALAGC
jgi:peptidoglycan/xylan/chitin deacetylase (PgdA/CDA1 family)